MLQQVFSSYGHLKTSSGKDFVESKSETVQAIKDPKRATKRPSSQCASAALKTIFTSTIFDSQPEKPRPQGLQGLTLSSIVSEEPSFSSAVTDSRPAASRPSLRTDSRPTLTGTGFWKQIRRATHTETFDNRVAVKQMMQTRFCGSLLFSKSPRQHGKKKRKRIYIDVNETVKLPFWMPLQIENREVVVPTANNSNKLNSSSLRYRRNVWATFRSSRRCPRNFRPTITVHSMVAGTTKIEYLGRTEKLYQADERDPGTYTFNKPVPIKGRKDTLILFGVYQGFNLNFSPEDNDKFAGLEVTLGQLLCAFSEESTVILPAKHLNKFAHTDCNCEIVLSTIPRHFSGVDKKATKPGSHLPKRWHLAPFGSPRASVSSNDNTPLKALPLAEQADGTCAKVEDKRINRSFIISSSNNFSADEDAGSPCFTEQQPEVSCTEHVGPPELSLSMSQFALSCPTECAGTGAYVNQLQRDAVRMLVSSLLHETLSYGSPSSGEPSPPQEPLSNTQSPL